MCWVGAGVTVDIAGRPGQWESECCEGFALGNKGKNKRKNKCKKPHLLRILQVSKKNYNKNKKTSKNKYI